MTNLSSFGSSGGGSGGGGGGGGGGSGAVTAGAADATPAILDAIPATPEDGAHRQTGPPVEEEPPVAKRGRGHANGAAARTGEEESRADLDSELDSNLGGPDAAPRAAGDGGGRRPACPAV